MTAGLVITIVGALCLAAAVTALGSLSEILVSGLGFGSIFREKNKEAAIFLSAISVIAVCLSYLAITDILKDYAGYMLFLPDGRSVQSVLSDWVKCPLEWSIVFWGGLVIALSQLLMLAIMLRSKRIEATVNDENIQR